MAHGGQEAAARVGGGARFFQRRDELAFRFQLVGDVADHAEQGGLPNRHADLLLHAQLKNAVPARGGEADGAFHRNVDPPRKPSVLPPGEVQRWPVPLGVEEQQALVAFGERSRALSVARQNELCEHLEPVTGLRGDAARERVLAAARWLAGRSAGDA